MPDVAYIGPGGRPLLRTLLGVVLRRRRHEQQRTLADVARAARVSVPYLSEVERGRKEASSEVLAAVCDALEVELSDVLAEVGHRLDAGRRVGANRAPLTVVSPPVHQRQAGTGTVRTAGVTLLAA